MRTVEESLQRADHDRALAESLAVQGDHGWCASVTFHAAEGLVDSLLIRDGRFTDDLDAPARIEFLKLRHPGIRADYEALKGRHLRARHGLDATADASTSTQVVARLGRIRSYVDRVHANVVSGR